MADRGGRTIPGQVYIEVEYDYEYTAKDKKIVIKQGERYLLVKKTNDDWWQVKPDENSKPFYVPAQYVKEVARKALMPPVKSGAGLLNNSTKMTQSLHLQRSTENVNKSPELSSFGKSSIQITGLVHDANQNIGPNSSSGQTVGLGLDPVPNNGKFNSDSQSPKVSSQSRTQLFGHFSSPEFIDIEKTSFSQEQSCDSAGEGSEKVHQDSESGDELSSSSTEQIRPTTPPNQGRPDSPVYANLQELKISQSALPPLPGSPAIQINGEWETHKDSTGRCYYYNRGTQERTWKPPRWTRDANINKGDCQNSGDQEESPPSTKPCFPENESSPSSPKHQATGQEKYGLLNVTKITENGKKVRKNWLSSWAVLQGSSLLFTKTQGSSTSWSFCPRGSIPELLLSLLSSWKDSVTRRPAVTSVNSDHPVSAVTFGGNQSKPEFTVDLKGATIELASKDKSSKKNVYELKTRQGTELLIQCDNDTLMNDWIKVLHCTISNQANECDEAVEEEVPDSPGVEKHDKEKDHKDSKKLRSMKVLSIDSSEQKKTKKNLKKFLTRRPTLQAVREKGYIKDQVFGSNLANLCQKENSTVPKFVKLCIEHVEEHGLDIDGIYRVSGNLAVIQKLRFTVNHDEKLDLNDSKWEDIHVITGALKMFFRELPEPLFTFNHFNDFVNAIKQEPRQRVGAVRDLIKQLPKPNQDTMQVLFRHLKRVVENGEKNRMTYQSVAIVFGPTLLKPEKETGNIAVHTVYQNQIVELILLELNSIFGR
ncbi:rho GTPase-activating protein 12 isoform X9 [Monodelphis domestica]|uniref:rho GTPase-activating protein 12 isoform X9 n=1 Tax=Monodelphis domestica TaxID=13616 RepID=UPI0024E1A988|nr:rho GTPase-activating protein 12 isoform X9 [Monodelphis domestica]